MDKKKGQPKRGVDRRDQGYTPEEAARILGLTQRRVQQLCQLGLLGEKVGGRYRIGKRELDAFARIHAHVKPGPKPKR